MNKWSLEQDTDSGYQTPHTHISLGSHTPHPRGKLAPPLPVNQYVTSSPHPTNYISPQNKGLGMLATPALWLTLLSLPSPCFAWTCASLPHLNKAHSLP